MKSNSIKKILILALILAVPGFLYYLLTEKGQNRYRPLGFFGPKTVLSSFHTKRGKKIPDTLYHAAKGILLYNTKAELIPVPDTAHHISVLSFFNLSAPSASSVNKSMESLVREYQGNKRLKFYSVGVSGESVAALGTFAKSYSTVPGKWEFLTGSPDKISQFARKQVFVDVITNKEGGSVIARQVFVLIDADGHIRGYYDALTKEQVDKLNDEIKVLIAEELRKIAVP